MNVRFSLDEPSFLLVQKLTLWRRRWNARGGRESCSGNQEREPPGDGGEPVEWPRGLWASGGMWEDVLFWQAGQGSSSKGRSR